MGMGLGGDLQLCNVVAILSFLGEGDKREKVVTVKKPATPEDVEDIKMLCLFCYFLMLRHRLSSNFVAE